MRLRRILGWAVVAWLAIGAGQLLAQTSGNQGLGSVTQSGAITSGHVATWASNGVIQDGGSPSGSGTVTSIATTSPITGGTITSTGTIACATCVTSAASLTANAPVIGGGSQATSTVAAMTNGQLLVGVTSAAPAPQSVSGDATLAASGALTLATVNSNVGSFTNANVTVDAKGRITAAANGSAGSGCTVSGSQFQIVAVNAAGTGCTADSNASVNAGALSLGASGTAGSVAMGNATSGTVTVSPVAGALGSVTASLPANTGTVAELNLAQTWSAVQTYTNSDLKLLGSSTGATTFTSANAGASNFTLTVPAVTDTLAVLGTAQSYTAAQRGTPVNISISTATFTPNFNTGQNFEIDLVHASCPCTLANPSTTLVAGQSGMIEIHQSATGSDTIGTWGSDYQYVGGTSTITLSTTASAVDYLSYYVNNAATGIVLGTLLKAPAH